MVRTIKKNIQCKISYNVLMRFTPYYTQAEFSSSVKRECMILVTFQVF